LAEVAWSDRNGTHGDAALPSDEQSMTDPVAGRMCLTPKALLQF